MVIIQVERQKAEDCLEKAEIQLVLKPCLVQKTDVSAEIRQYSSSAPFSLNTSDYVSCHQ